ncbi:MAG: menaquinone biosynthesis protein [Armatimonadota bacterium]|nr:menaquinone biosynthesis protein [Armatimonadota bacterium]MDR5702554.1 menaquinone biosynthesis protein [Armatimonadota bacterium]MDR7434456.1 menaquinone biosynthesis protein [Armatimonadota bacterium]
MRIGRYPYLNSIPFFWRNALWPGELVSCTPRVMGLLAARGELDAGPLAIVDLLRLEDQFEPLPYGIVAPQAAQSVLLFSQLPIEQLQGTVIGISEETSTSVRLLQVLLEVRYKVRPASYLRGGKGEAVLVIGDEALRKRRNPEGLLVYDLGREWYEWMGLPFVFARWAIRRSLPAEAKRQIVWTLEESMEECFASLPSVCSRHAPEWLSPKELEDYLRGFSYWIGDKEEQAISLFRSYLQEKGEAPALTSPAAPGFPS